MVVRLHLPIKSRLMLAFKNREGGVPRDVANSKQLTVNAIQSRVDELMKFNLPAVNVDRSEFASFRHGLEEDEKAAKVEADKAIAGHARKRAAPMASDAKSPDKQAKN